MQILKVQVFDPLYHPSGSVLPARMEILVTDADLHTPVSTDYENGWTIARYEEFFYLFWHDGQLGEKRVPDEEYNEETVEFFEGWLNALGPLTETLFPVTVTNGIEPWRVFYVPAHVVLRWLDELVPATSAGRWTLQANTGHALEGKIVFDLEFQPARARDFRAEHARLLR